MTGDGTDRPQGDQLGALLSRAEQVEGRNGDEVAGSTMKVRAGRVTRNLLTSFLGGDGMAGG